MYRRGAIGDNGLIHEVVPKHGALIPEFQPDVDDMWMALLQRVCNIRGHAVGVDFDGR